MKYIIFKTPHGDLVPILFLAPVTHKQIANLMGIPGLGWIPRSAGFYDPQKFQTFGESQSLNLQPAEADAQLIGMLHRATFQSATGHGV